MKNIQLAPSILAADFSKLGEEAKKCEEAGTQRIHIDVMDGHFVPNISIGPFVVEHLRKVTDLPLDVHLMIEKPHRYIDDFIQAGANLIAFHVEEYRGKNSPPQQLEDYPKVSKDIDEERIREVIQQIRSKKVKVCLALNPPTKLFIHNLLPLIDEVLIMTVNPGFGGQKFIPSTLEKIRTLRKIYSGDIKVDGGVNQETAGDVVKAGANVLVIGTYFFKSANPRQAVENLLSFI